MIAAIIFLVAALVLAGTVLYVKHKVSDAFEIALGTRDIKAGLESVNQMSYVTPKSVSAATSLYLPKISKDFPDFNYDETKRRAEKVLLTYLTALHERSEGYLSEGTEELKVKLTSEINSLKNTEQKVAYNEPKIHQTEIFRYTKSSSRAVITFQTAIQYKYVKTNADGKVKEGDYDNWTQDRYNIECIYIQDRNLAENAKEDALGSNCPNCGAPVSGNKICPYCGAGITEFNIRAWGFSDITRS